MNNKKLKNKLNIYADSLERKEEILYGAYHAMDQKRSSASDAKKKSMPKKRFGLAGLTAAAVIFVIAIGIVLSNFQNHNPTNPSLNPYSLSSLQKQSLSQDDYYNLTDVMFFTDEAGQADGKFYIYVNEKNEIYAAKAVYRVIRDGEVDEISIISDLKNNLSDYKNYKPSENNPVVRYFDVYKNGEYHSYLSTLIDNMTYYITISSPSMNAGTYYENILL